MKIHQALTRFSGSPAMKLLSVLFLAGLALCYAVPHQETRELSVDEVQELDLFLGEVLEEERSTRDLKENLKNMFDRLMEKVAEVIEEGKEVESDFTNRLKILVKRIMANRIDLEGIRDKIKERAADFSEKIKDAWNNFWEQLNLGPKEYAEGERNARDLKESLKNLFDRLMEKVAEVTERGKDVNSNLMDRVKNIVQKLKDKGIDLEGIKNRIKERGGSIPEKLRETWKNFWEKLGMGSKDDAEVERSSRSLRENLRSMFDRLFEKVADGFGKGKDVNSGLLERVRNLIDKMKNKGFKLDGLKEKIKERGGRFPEKFRDAWTNFWGRLGMGSSGYVEGERSTRDAKETLNNMFDRLLEMVTKSFEKKKEINEQLADRIKNLLERAKKFGVDFREKLIELSGSLSEEARKLYKEFLKKIGIVEEEEELAEFAEEKRNAEEETKERFNKILNKLIERLRRFLEKGREIRQSIVDRVKDMLQKMKDIGMGESDIDGKFRSLMGNLSEKGKKSLRELLEKLGIKRDERMIEFADEEGGDEEEDVKKRMGNILQKFLDKLKNALESRRGISQRLVDRMKEMLRKMKNFGLGDSDIIGRFTGLFEKLNDKGKKALDNLMTRLGLKKEQRMIELADDGNEDEGEDDSVKGRLGRIFGEFLDKLKNVLNNNRNMSQRIVDRMKEMIKKMKNLGIGESDIMAKFSDLNKKMTDKGKEALDRLLKRLGLKKEERMIAFADEGEDPVVTKELREKFEDLMQKIKDALKNGRSFRDGLEKLKEIRERLKELRGKLGDKAKELVEKLREKIKEYFQKWMEKFNGKEERSLKDIYENIKEYLKNLQIDLKERFVKFGEWAKEKFEEGLEKGKDRSETLKKLAREFIFDAKLLGKDTVLQAKYFFKEYKEDLGELYIVVKEKIKEKLESIEIYERVREYLRNLNIELKEKFAKFGEWAKEKFERGLEQRKDRAENVKNLARQFIDDAKVIGKDVAEQAKGFFREYKEDLGTIYDRVREKVREILERED